MLFATIHTFGSDALSGGSQISLLVTTAACAFIGVAFYRIPWRDYEIAITNNISGVATAIIILLIIGALSGAWMISGVVPALIYYGMQILHPDFFLASTCLICVIISVMTGSSWTTIATIGIALLGIGKAQGFNEGWIAGAIISGAYFGDKVSPLSETTILAASVTETPLFRHIKYMMITTIPSLVISLILFTVMGLTHDTGGTEQISEISAALDSKFNITPWLLIVPIVTGILIARKVPSIITLFASTLLAGLFALIFQPDLLREIAGNGSLFKGCMMTFYGSTSLQTDNAMLTELVATRGMGGMMNTVWLILCAMCFGGAMTASGMLGSITSVFVRFMKNTFSMVTSTVVIPNAIKVTLPQSQKQTAAKPLTRVTIDASLNYYVAFGNQREVRVSFDEITPFLQESYAKEPEMFVALYADETVPYKEIVKILNIANENKFKMVLATRPQ